MERAKIVAPQPHPTDFPPSRLNCNEDSRPDAVVWECFVKRGVGPVVRGIRINPFGWGVLLSGWGVLLSGWGVLLSAALIVGVVPPAFAGNMVPGSDPPLSGQPSPSGSVESTPLQAGPFRAGFPVGGWMIYPSVFVGAVFDDNVRQIANGIDHKSGVGISVVPNFIETYDGGIHQTSLYQVVDARFFPRVGSSAPGEAPADSVAATAGFRHNYEAMRDLRFNFYGDYTRETDIF